MNKGDLEILVASPAKGGGKGMPPKSGAAALPKKPPAKGGDDTVERTYLHQALDAILDNDDRDAAVTALIQGIRACVQKELDEGY